MKKLTLWLMQTKLYAWALKHVIPYIRFSMYYTSLRGDKYHEGYFKLQPGHFVVTTDSKKMTSFLIPGEFSHAAYCVSRGYVFQPVQRIGAMDVEIAHPHEIVEMTHTDYTKSHFFDICKEADRVAIFDCTDWSADHKKLMIAAANSFKNATYDVQFTLGVQSLYCSELIYQADLLANKGTTSKLAVNLADLAGLGRPYISPDGLIKAPNAKCIWDSAGVLTGLTGAEIRKKLAA